MKYQIQRAQMNDLGRIEEIYAIARGFMADHGNPNQWGNSYPPRDMLLEDIQKNCLFVLISEGIIHGVFYFYIGVDPCYGMIHNGFWRSDLPYGTIHRIAGDGTGGVLKNAVEFCQKRINHLRIDTHKDNTVMQKAILNLGFSERGIVYMEDGTPRIAYDLL